MIDLDKWQEIAATLGKNKVRTGLTALGVFWGIFMLVGLLAVGDALQRGVRQNMFNFAPNSIYVWGQSTSMPYQGLQPGRRVQFEVADIEAVARVPGVEHLAPRTRLGGWRDSNNVIRGGKTGNFGVIGSYPAFRHILRYEMVAGRWLNPLDLDERRKVALIGDTVYQQLFDRGEDPIGLDIEVRGVYFEVIGVFRPQGKSHDVDREAQSIYVPFTTFQQAFNASNRVGWFSLTARPEVPGEQVEEAVRQVLAARHKVAPEDKEGIGSFNVAKETRKVRAIFLGIQILIWLVGSFTLMAGVLGVSNIMLIAVKERTKEFGVRKALGATPGAIIRMVLAEALALTAAAGYLGLLSAVLAVEFAGPMLDGAGPMVTPMVDFRAAVFATIILVVGGVLAGVIPARHAARIKPVEALRAE